MLFRSRAKGFLYPIMFKIIKGYDHIQKTLRIPTGLAEKLELLASENNISFNQLVIQCLEYALSNLVR